jgi:putative FmdB family regulatory protein
MPIYEYRCTACRREFEYQHSMNDPDRVKCEACGAYTLERLISWTSVRTNNWQPALHTDNPKEALRGLNVVDGGKSHRFTGNEAVAAPATALATASATTSAASGEAEAGGKVGDAGAGPDGGDVAGEADATGGDAGASSKS